MTAPRSRCCTEWSCEGPRLKVTVDWGLTGALACAAPVVVVCDVLSFSTAVSVVLDRGATVCPYRWGPAADDFARQHDAVLARGRGAGGLSLSPASIRAAAPFERLVLSSPNGATICAALSGRVVLAGCLRTATAVGAWIRAHHPGAEVAVIAAGEQWPDGSLRPAVEDLWGAGAVVEALDGARSPEADAAVAAWRGVSAADVALHACVSGRELDGRRFGADVDLAAEVDGSPHAPLLVDGWFRAAA